MAEANDLEKPETAAWPGRVDPLVGHSSCSCDFVLLGDEAECSWSSSDLCDP